MEKIQNEDRNSLQLPSTNCPETTLGSQIGYSCLKCNLSFRFKKDLEHHQDDNKKTFECDICQKSFVCLIGLNQHIGKKHTTHRPYRCLLCSKRFKTIYAVRNHRKQVHMHSTMQTCPSCGKNLFNNFSLSRHVKVCSTHQV